MITYVIYTSEYLKPHPCRGALFQFAIGISVEGYIRCADLTFNGVNAIKELKENYSYSSGEGVGPLQNKNK